MGSQGRINTAKGIQGAGTTLQALSIMANASATKADLSSKINALSIFQDETDRRHGLQVSQLRKSAKNTVARQEEAFLQGGVKLEGSALDVIADTYYDLLNAELESEKERGFAEQQLRVKQANMKSKRSQVDTQAALGAAGTILGGFSA